jgi:hypothetical protein
MKLFGNTVNFQLKGCFCESIDESPNFIKICIFRSENVFLLSSYMEYNEKIGFTPKILIFFFYSNHVFTGKKS